MSDLTPTERLMLEQGYTTLLTTALNEVMNEVLELKSCTITPHKIIIGIAEDGTRQSFTLKPYITYAFKDGRELSIPMETLPKVVTPMFASHMAQELRTFLAKDGASLE